MRGLVEPPRAEPRQLARDRQAPNTQTTYWRRRTFMTPRIKTLLASFALVGTLGVAALTAGTPVHAASVPIGIDDCAAAREHPLPLIDNTSGLTTMALGGNGYSLTLGQFGTRGQLVSAAFQRT